ncbi:GNAT family N-acetyltransferase [Candidatus Enterococcus clewellii]|uniref:N-acetyltransferase domain-containing protein n=1 Tax=Candidatus Enterococcus clewellii TaxID=1834193 RepID=A0A242KB80_9ENTE|nr:N-acetyltransferase [Enterococcus sp. 9E7_DIV0242]OTP18317.1 hypothetical protein A5888_000131 [Enterococcus sp. 9E7_DIV0242]
MNENLNEKMYVTKKLTGNEKAAIRELKATVEKENIGHKLDLDYLDADRSKHLLLWNDEKLEVYAWLSSFDPQELEVSIISQKPERYFETVLAYLHSYVEKQKISEAFLIVDQRDERLKKSIEQMQCKADFSEAYMELNQNNFNPMTEQLLSLTKGTAAERKEIGRFMNDGEDYDIPQEDLDRIMLYKEADDIFSCLRIDESEGRFGIYGFVVQKEQRGRGIGRKVLSTAILEILKKNPKLIYLEVETNNLNAFHLYCSLGFEVKRQFDYYTFQ